ncbi:uncharacterized protein LOC116267153 [Nymphaea colorata]|nr:uncharacterized protein LOC116267153 [Nymphaea colorata]XP_031504600.1 uncharacterized protein LOC116267153 [Nymphaea colorata]XP_031504601.1 uncharacterized protein LOC116267153 [Nymphaea colorata]XP_049937234.1 uncharacterized protein LOC116267153 [Nymphaea colorata]XP_049937235.1 uncharacterized protein LOC116267153 [Nymphaea colorata]
MKKYGLQLRAPAQPKKTQTASIRPLPSLFRDDDDDDDVEKEIARQASKQKSLRDVEAQHKKALEEDPTVFDYDGVYDEMKEKIARPIMQDRQKREVKYVHSLMKTAKIREKEQDIVYERKLLKERSKEDHLYEDKEKFVTSAYKKKLAEQAKWLEEERLRELREQKDDVTKKDITDFYFNLSKNVAFGAQATQSDRMPLGKPQEMAAGGNKILFSGDVEAGAQPAVASVQKDVKDETEKPLSPQRDGSAGVRLLPDVSTTSKIVNAEHASASETVVHPHHKRSNDALAAAKERYMARKRTKEQ